MPAADSGEPTPWYTAYRDEFLRLMAFGDHEAVDHPVACEWRAHCGCCPAQLRTMAPPPCMPSTAAACDMPHGARVCCPLQAC